MTAANAKFLTKEPIVGLKVFDGENLRKRLQVTFGSEGHFNTFANKMHQWLGVSVTGGYAELQRVSNDLSVSFSSQLPAAYESLQPPLSQVHGSQATASQVRTASQVHASQVHASQAHASQLPHVELSQVPLTQDQFNQTSSQVPNYELATQDLSYAHLLAPRTHDAEDIARSLMHLRGTAPSQSIPERSFLCPSALDAFTPDTTQFTQNLLDGTINTYNMPTVTLKDLADALLAVPFQPIKKRKSKKLKKSSSKNMEQALESVLRLVLEKADTSFLELQDEELRVKISRKLKSKSFLRLAQRVETLLEPELDEEEN